MLIHSRTVSAAMALTLLICAATPAAAGRDESGHSADAVARANTGEGKTADVWENVRVSKAYTKLKCPRCGTSNDLRATECRRCGYPFPQPSPDVTDPSQVFVPGRGYYREGTLLEPAKSRKILWIPGIVIGAIGLSTMSLALTLWAADNDVTEPVSEGVKATAWVGFGMTALGATLAIIGFTNKTEAVYAYAEPEGRPAVARAPRDAAGRADDVTIKFGLSFNLF